MSENRRGSVDEEVQKLFKKNSGKISPSDFMKLRQRYDDSELVDKIQKAFLEKHAAITKKAKKFAQLIREKYSDSQYPFHILLEKARLFKAKHGLTDEEFAEFQRIYEQELVGLKSPEVLVPSTNLMKLLGSVNVEFHGFNTKLNDNDYKFLQEILNLHSSSRPLHAQVLLQSMQYSGFSFEAISGEFKRELGHRPGDSVHPVIAALFLPKINVLESHFLHSNIAGIVKARKNNESFNNRSDYELFYSLTNDPNDVVCDNRSPMQDLLARAQIQHQLWNCVLELRNGRYYHSSFREFLGAVDSCRLNRQDTPDFIYGRYDGTVLKRLLSAFSFRPTIVATTPVYQIVNINPYQQNVRPVVTAVPMINLRLPPTNDDTPVSLLDALEQHQYFLENGAMVPRHTSLVYSRGVLFFFVDRRSSVIKLQDIQPFNLSRMPVIASGFEQLNDREIDCPLTIPYKGDTYELTSVVVAEVNTEVQEKNVVVGSSTLFRTPVNPEKGIYDEQYLHYDPLSVTDFDTTSGKFRGPITSMPLNTIDEDINSFIGVARSRGIIFMYTVKERNLNELSY
jgi:hypothetical protein